MLTEVRNRTQSFQANLGGCARMRIQRIDAAIAFVGDLTSELKGGVAGLGLSGACWLRGRGRGECAGLRSQNMEAETMVFECANVVFMSCFMSR